MPIWTKLDSQDAINSFLTAFWGFHDACLRQILVSTETFVTERYSMACPGHLDTSALLFLQSQNSDLPAVEIKIERVTGIHVTPTPDGCDSIIMDGTIVKVGEVYRLGLHFTGAPLIGEPNSTLLIYERDEPDVEVTGQAMAWRPIPDGLAEQLLFHQRELG